MYVYVEDSKANLASLNNTTYEEKKISKVIVYILLIMFQISLHYNKKNNQNVWFKFSVHDALLEEPSTGNAQNRQNGKPNNLEV
jgi:hypothetical protein